MTSKRLTPEHVHAVGVAAIENAIDLMADAATLLEAGRPRRAYAIGVIAVEELAKFNTCRTALRDWNEPLTVAQLNGLLKPAGRSHVRRYADTLVYLSALGSLGGNWPERLEELGAMAKQDQLARQWALYVEVSPSGEPLTPARVTDAEASDWVSGMVRWFSMLAPTVWRDGIDEELASAQAKPS